MALRITLTLFVIFASTSSALAQGSIFGAVSNADNSAPSDGRLSFFGYLNGTDEEIRIVTSDGAGYDAGFWFDDFQNFLTESPGIPYDYHFCNVANGEGFHLTGLVPDNSFQQENVQLGPEVRPPAPRNIMAEDISPSEVKVSWHGSPGSSYHIYRRYASSNGTFFRLDNPSGDLSDPGISDTFFVDTPSGGSSEYVYLVIAEDSSGRYSPVIAMVGCGDTDNSGSVDIDDIIFLVNYIFLGGPSPDPVDLGDTDCSGEIDIDDVIYLVGYIFLGGNDPCDTNGDTFPDC